MIATSVRFILPPDTDWDAMRKLMQERSKLYESVPGLRSKAFVLNVERREYGGNYVWESHEALDKFMRSELYLSAVRKLGEPAEVKIFEVPAYIDNTEREIAG